MSFKYVKIIDKIKKKILSTDFIITRSKLKVKNVAPILHKKN